MKTEHLEWGLALEGELDAMNAQQVDAALQEALIESCGAFLIDLTGLTFMDSGGVNELLRARSLLGREERELVVVCPPGAPRRVLELIGIADLFALFATRAEAEGALV